jgi:hypothetical protein
METEGDLRPRQRGGEGRAMTFAELADKVCGEIPMGWEVVIRLSRECGYVELEDPDGEDVDVSGDGIEESVFAALRRAIRCETEGEGDVRGS